MDQVDLEHPARRTEDRLEQRVDERTLAPRPRWLGADGIDGIADGIDGIVEVKVGTSRPFLHRPARIRSTMPSGQPAPGADPTSPVVLLVEDNADAREALRALLELDGYDVEAAADGVKALEIIRARSPHVAVIDIGLPGVDGYEVARRIRDLQVPQPALIALTGYSQPEDRRRAKEAGFDAHLVKPVDPAELTRVLSTIRTPGRGFPE
jgi:CheY-like chemotaxis protein